MLTFAVSLHLGAATAHLITRLAAQLCWQSRCQIPALASSISDTLLGMTGASRDRQLLEIPTCNLILCPRPWCCCVWSRDTRTCSRASWAKA